MRKGVTPVVAIVLLLLLTIAAAGTAFTFVQTIIEEQAREGRGLAASSLTIRDIDCNAASDNVLIKATNNGDANLNNADLFGYYVANNSLAFTNTTGMHDWPADTFNEHNFTVDTSISSNTRYRIELRFDNSYETTEECDAQ